MRPNISVQPLLQQEEAVSHVFSIGMRLLCGACVFLYVPMWMSLFKMAELGKICHEFTVNQKGLFINKMKMYSASCCFRSV